MLKKVGRKNVLALSTLTTPPALTAAKIIDVLNSENWKSATQAAHNILSQHLKFDLDKVMFNQFKQTKTSSQQRDE